MSKAVRILGIVAVCVFVAGGLAHAWSNDPSTCTTCHPRDANVSVTVTQGGCTPDGANKYLTISVSNTYSGTEGWAVFDPVVNIRNGYQLYGSFSTTVVPSNRTYQIFGVSGYGTYQTANLGGANSVAVVPYCPPTTCIDADADGSSISGGFCGVPDCNDANASVHPGATEVKHDGIDQDCNGYDLTIEVVKATYSTRTSKLTVQARSDFGAAANLTVDSYGAMAYNKKTGIWSLTVSTSPKPATVTVRGFEGSVTVPVQ